MVNQVELNTPAPNFILADFTGQEVNLESFRGKKNVILVFNRGFF
ncbi:MAG: hypothetical protein U0V02_14180 [Anaerolineales bacterium]